MGKKSLRPQQAANDTKPLVAVQFTCDKCQFKKSYSTGADEYPACITIEYCSKGHWEGGDTPSEDDIDIWSNCADFSPSATLSVDY